MNRSSETDEQREYERYLLNRHYPEVDHRYSSPKVTDKDGADTSSSSSLSDKLSHLWNDHLKTLPSEITSNVGIVKNAIHTNYVVDKDAQNPDLYPEITKVAEVRHGLDLAAEEQVFLEARRVHVRNHFARYMGLDPQQVHPEDVPIIAFGGSGGGFRAMLGTVGYAQQMKKNGLWDLFTYVAGVSGACWSIAAYYTTGQASTERLLDNWKNKLSPHHPLSPEAVHTILTVPPDGVYVTLGPLDVKHKSGLGIVAMDLYSVFTTGHLYLHDEPGKDYKATGECQETEHAGHHHSWYKWTSAKKYIADGKEPLPILTAIRHERPWKDWVDKENAFKEPDHAAWEHSSAKDAWFQWFEMTPYEIGCDELEAWVPTWGFGRPFLEGKSTKQLPEQSLSLLLGLATSAPAGPLNSYLSTIDRNLPKNFLGNAIKDLADKVSHMWGKQKTEEFEDHHPLHACNEFNPLFHLTPVAKGQTRHPGLENSPNIHLIDSGMDNNCPTYVLLHPKRHVDVILNLDFSSDVQKDSFPDRVQQIGSRRGLKFTRRNKDAKPTSDDPKDLDRFKHLYAQIYDGVLAPRPEEIVDSYGNTVQNPPAPIVDTECTCVYMPLLPNERVVPGYDPSTAKFSGSYNLVWTPEQVDMIIKVSEQNFIDGEAIVKTALRDAWQRKRAKRESY